MSTPASDGYLWPQAFMLYMRNATTAIDYVKLTCLEDAFINKQANMTGRGSSNLSHTDGTVYLPSSLRPSFGILHFHHTIFFS